MPKDKKPKRELSMSERIRKASLKIKNEPPEVLRELLIQTGHTFPEKKPGEATK